MLKPPPNRVSESLTEASRIQKERLESVTGGLTGLGEKLEQAQERLRLTVGPAHIVSDGFQVVSPAEEIERSLAAPRRDQSRVRQVRGSGQRSGKAAHYGQQLRR